MSEAFRGRQPPCQARLKVVRDSLVNIRTRTLLADISETLNLLLICIKFLFVYQGARLCVCNVDRHVEIPEISNFTTNCN